MERTSVYFKRPQNTMFFGLTRTHVHNHLRHEDDYEREVALLGPTRELKQQAH
jgi:hypothetical protein